MTKTNLILLLAFLGLSLNGLGQDTVTVNTLNYNSKTRDTVISFPDGTDSYEKILMLYSMRCKGALISDGANRNRGCGEWDYSCNTYLVDSTKSDSLLSTTADYSISNFSGSTFNYTSTPLNNYYRKKLKNVTVLGSSNVLNHQLGSATESSSVAIPLEVSGTDKSNGMSLNLFTASELTSAGLSAGPINAIELEALSNTTIQGLRVTMKHEANSVLDINNLEYSGFQEVYYNNLTFNVGKNTIQFHQPFMWDGTSSIIVQYSFSSNASNQGLDLKSTSVGKAYNAYTNGGNSFFLDGQTYVETDSYKGILGSTSRTISAWIKTTTVNGEILSYGRNAAGEKWVFRVNGNGKLRVEVNGGYIVGTTDLIDDKWHHVACVLDGTNVSDIKLYVDGNLEANTELGDRSINTVSDINVRISRGVNNRYFIGNIDEVRMWSSVKNQTEIKQIMNGAQLSSDLDLVLHYSFDSNNDPETKVDDQSSMKNDAAIFGNKNVKTFRGYSLFKGWNQTDKRVNTNFITGDFTINVDTTVVYDTIAQFPHTVTQYEIISKPNSIENDEISALSKNYYWNSDSQNKFIDENGNIYDSTSVTSEGSIDVKSMTYYRRWASRLELLSFVTPYGIGLDLGKEGKTWTFDMTDFTPVLKGKKRLFLSRGGQNQEEMDIKFLFIKGTPAREVLAIDQIWPTQQYSANYTQIQQNTTYFPPVEYQTLENAKSFKVRSAITGHGQDGEFIGRNHIITASDTSFKRFVWKTCGDNPVYPQGGTWIYDRAGWCPGMATDMADYDISSKVGGGEKITLDYNVEGGSGDSRYIVNNQIVSYGDYNFKRDVGIIDIIEPSNKIEHGRDNPMCINPKMLAQNTGSELVTSITVDYWVNDKTNKRTFKWPCHLYPGGVEKIYFPIDDGVWSSAITGNSIFTAEIVEVNGSPDEYANNNIYHSPFELPEMYPSNMYFFYRTNLAGAETSFVLKDEWGTVLLERKNLDPNTIYRDTVPMGLGCKSLEILDSDGDGMSFWANNDGGGFFRLMKLGGGVLKTFEPDFGNGTKLNFTIMHTLDIPKKEIDLGFELYPNPTNGVFNVSGGDLLNADYEVYNSFGQVVLTPTTFNGQTLQIDLTNQASGMYFLKITKEGHTWTKKVILN